MCGCATSSVATHKANREPTSTKIAAQVQNNVISDQLSDLTTPTEINGYTKQTDSNGSISWKNTSGQTANGWQNNQNDWYYFNNGQSTTNWQRVDNNWYYMSPQDSRMETGLQPINGATYYLNTQHDGTYGAMK
ncbi:hypothetical protein LTY21_02085, partial [Limosilactobacillus fastidiosus]|nr:hypothetical protein [Limosilactobacillus fastidiosus]MCD7085335.1 hypothetical protein [Limosilactobacillus fastidiosus]MCD7114928.1 hypothetical protein [Limosilactobacillus fastidiosus]MCD7116785.1 hypothetical protein [Limosilactobacillus fastidiosus]